MILELHSRAQASLQLSDRKLGGGLGFGNKARDTPCQGLIKSPKDQCCAVLHTLA